MNPTWRDRSSEFSRPVPRDRAFVMFLIVSFARPVSDGYRRTPPKREFIVC
jgi:hypothetical protein